jgi:putative hemolysin
MDDANTLTTARTRAHDAANAPGVTPVLAALAFAARQLEPIAEAEAPRLLNEEVLGLAACHTLVATGDYVVIVAQRQRIPRIMNEIGRLREISFRAAGEGTGKSRDIDSFDDWYLQLFVWHRKDQQVLGAYRLGMTDVVRQRQGDSGMYTHSLFSYDGSFLDALGPAVEMGRTFVRPELQGGGRVLALLWRGIAHLLAARPRYRTLFGPVSISSTYTRASRQLIASSLCQGEHRHPLFGSVSPKRPYSASAEETLGDVKALSRRVAALEPDHKGLPVLVKEYVKLGGRFLGFSVDPDFQDALDGFVVVHLDRTNPKLLSLYMGSENYERFRAWKKPAARAQGPVARARLGLSLSSVE